VIHSAYSESGSDEYMRFFLLECCERDIGHFGFSNAMNRYELQRFCNIIDQTILSIVRLDKFVIHICRGNVLTLFLNIALASDYRIVTTDTVFHHIFQEIGMLPKGGVAFFLNNMVGAGKARDLLLLHRQLTADRALRHGIVDQVVAPEELESTAMGVVRSVREVPALTVAGIKRLINYSIRELEDYLAFETSEINKIGKTREFKDQ
jgi:enoyl-CoA hydratase/carnithine racemase